MSGIAAGALQGFRILDLTSVVMGPFATQVLADYGAEVIKIEPLEGDTTRNIGPCRERGLSAGFIGMNRGKQSLAIDLKQPAGRQLVLRLAQEADALVCNLRPQAMRRLGLHYEAVAAANPRIVYLSLVGYGRRGRYAGKPAYDDLIQAAIGLPRLVQRADGGEPRYVPLAMCDRTVGIAAVNALLAALLHRERGGQGQEIEVPMFELMSMLLLSDHLGGAAFDPPQGPMGYARLLSRQRRPYATLDGYISVLPYNDAHWRRFFALAGRPDLPDSDPRFADIAQRTRNIDALYQLLADALRGKDTREWLQLLDEADIPAMPLHTLETLLDDPHLRESGLFAFVEHPAEGRMRALRNPALFSRTPVLAPAAAPRLGEHTRSALLRAGLGEAEVEQLLADGVVRASA
jgi:crotonobetainyl-CoA:carnitine CoA-transferase CaiB-like acyl-CoA transferase